MLKQINFTSNYIVDTTFKQNQELEKRIQEASMITDVETSGTKLAPFRVLTCEDVSDLGSKIVLVTEKDAAKLGRLPIGDKELDEQMAKRGISTDIIGKYKVSTAKKMPPEIKLAYEDYLRWTQSKWTELHKSVIKIAEPLSFEEAIKKVETYIKNIVRVAGK